LERSLIWKLLRPDHRPAESQPTRHQFLGRPKPGIELIVV
jgi:hypothetical protein